MSNPEIDIRPRHDEDIPALARVLVEVHAKDGYPVEGVADPEAWLHLDNMLGAWVATLDGDPVGHVGWTEPRPGDDAARLWLEQHPEDVESVTVLGRLFVSPAARGHRLGEHLTRAVMDTAQTEGCPLVPMPCS